MLPFNLFFFKVKKKKENQLSFKTWKITIWFRNWKKAFLPSENLFCHFIPWKISTPITTYLNLQWVQHLKKKIWSGNLEAWPCLSMSAQTQQVTALLRGLVFSYTMGRPKKHPSGHGAGILLRGDHFLSFHCYKIPENWVPSFHYFWRWRSWGLVQLKSFTWSHTCHKL